MLEIKEDKKDNMSQKEAGFPVEKDVGRRKVFEMTRGRRWNVG